MTESRELVKHDAVIARRLQMVREDIETHQAREAHRGVKGGSSLFLSVAFHQRREALLLWMAAASVTAIETKRVELEAALGADVALKYRSMVGVSRHVAEQIAHLELVELALGLHPCQRVKV